MIWQDGILRVSGKHFTQWSNIAIDGVTLDTVYVDSGFLTTILKELPEDGAVVTVRQDAPSKVTLFESMGFIFNN